MRWNPRKTDSLIWFTVGMAITGVAAAHGLVATQKPSTAHANLIKPNGNHKRSATEFSRLPQVIQKRRFNRLDTNNDGKIERSEFLSRAESQANQLFNRLDQNHSGGLSRQEYQNIHQWIGRMRRELNHDPFLSMKSSNHGRLIQSHHQSSPNQGFQKSLGQIRKNPKWSGHGWCHDPIRQHRPKINTDQLFTRIDSNDNGFVSKQEWQQAVRHWVHFGNRNPL